MNASKWLAGVLLWLLGSSPLLAQPATATLQLIPPHAPYLADFTEPTSQSLLYTLQMIDPGTTTLDVRLKMTITGAGISMSTNENWIPPAITLTAGVPAVFSGYDLIEYFDPYHLDFTGISREAFINNGGLLPEGFYEVCIQAWYYDPGTNQIASNNACGSAFMEYYDPPQITAPIGVQTATNPQTLLFSWLPLHPSGAFITEYDLQVWTIVPNMSYEQIINFEAPLFQTTITNLTTFLYGLSEPLLTPGQGYITRVRARAQNGAGVFKNNGFSVVESWYWGATSNDCDPPVFADLEVVGVGNLRVNWIPPQGIAFDGFTIRYREINPDPDPPGPWTEVNTEATATQYDIMYLFADDVFEIEIRTNCTSGESEWLPVGVKTINQDLYSCGLDAGGFPIDNINPLTELRVGDIFHAGDFDIKVTQASGGNGEYYGKGYVEVPFFNEARLNVKFNKIRINELYYLIKGEIVVTGAGVALLDEAAAAALQDIMNTLENADDVLAAAEQILQTLDEIIAMVEPYLPDNIIQDLINAQQALEDARAMANDPNVSPEDAAAALNNAQALLDAANAAYQAALIEFFQDFFDVIITAIGELYDEYQAESSTIESEYITAKNDIDSWLSQANGEIPDGDAYGTPPVEMDVGSSFEDLSDQINDLIQQDPSMADFVDKSDVYYQKEMPYIIKLVIDELKTQITEVENSKALASALEAEGFNLLETIGQMLKAERPQAEIVTAAKTDIILGLTKILLRF
ncbi:MAG: fibronectin type III domain-containing protein [Bacteroidota bacterium]